MITQLKYYLKSPAKILLRVFFLFGKNIPDTLYLKILYFLHFKRFPDFKKPKTFNEKLQWLKLYNRNLIYTTMVDKIEAKKYVAERLGERYIIPTLSVYNSPQEINFDELPDQFVLKTNHDSGGIVICQDKSKLDRQFAIKKLSDSLKRDYSTLGREWPYKNVPRKIFAEQFIVDESGYELKDYKVFCFNGNPEFIQVDFDRFAKSGHKRNLYDINWNLLPFQYGYPSNPSHIIPKPSALSEMLFCAQELAKDIPFLRVDFYSINESLNESLKFGENTFFLESVLVDSIDSELGDKLSIDNISKISKDNKTMNTHDINRHNSFNGGGGMMLIYNCLTPVAICMSGNSHFIRVTALNNFHQSQLIYTMVIDFLSGNKSNPCLKFVA